MARRGNRRLILCFYDVLFFIAVSLTYLGLVNFCGSYLKYRNDWGFWVVSAIMLASWLFFRTLFGIYKSIWRYVQLSLSLRLLLADIAAGAVAVIPAIFIGRSFAAWHTGIVMMGFAILSLLARFVYQYSYRKKNIVGNACSIRPCSSQRCWPVRSGALCRLGSRRGWVRMRRCSP